MMATILILFERALGPIKESPLMKSEPCLRCSFSFKVGLVFAWLTLASGCATNPAPATATSFDAEGVYVRHLRLRLAPSHTHAFEAMMKRCVEAASGAKLPEPYDWLCYREPPGRYWLLLFSDTIDGFATPETLVGFADHIGRAEGESALAEIMAMLAGLEYEIEWEIFFQQKANWSTVEAMSTASHPKARIMDRTIRPGMEAAFEAALAARTAFLVDHGYPLPVEGFVIRSGAPQRALQVVFPVDWSTFHETDSFSAFVRGLDEAAQEEYAERKASLMATMSRAEYNDGNFAPELSYRSE